MSTTRTELQQRAQSTLIQYAFFRWETALILATTIVLTFLLPRPFFWWPRFGWPLLGLIAVVLLVYSSLTDADANADVLLRLYQEQFDPRTIQDKDLRGQVETALEYQRRIEMQIRQQDNGPIRDRLEDTAARITDWVGNIYALALRLAAYRGDDLLGRERDMLPQEIARLQTRRKQETSPAVQKQLDDVLTGKQRQWQSLAELDARMREASLRLEQSLTALATVYSQIHLVDAQNVGRGRADRLQADIMEQIARLNDLVSSINDVYDYNTKGLG